LGDGSDPLAPNAIETLKARDLSRATPGDLLQLQAGEHDIDEQATRDRSGGTVQSRGQGGDRIWQEALDPAEQRAVKRYFE
jgi:hypothetical protein